MYRIRRFGVVRTANVFAIVYLVITLVFVIPFALILAAGPVTTTDAFGNTTQVDVSPIFLLFIPLIYAAVGWLFTALFCLLYNLASWMVGGIEVEVEGGPVPAATPVPPPMQQPPMQQPPVQQPPA